MSHLFQVTLYKFLLLYILIENTCSICYSIWKNTINCGLMHKLQQVLVTLYMFCLLLCKYKTSATLATLYSFLALTHNCATLLCPDPQPNFAIQAKCLSDTPEHAVHPFNAFYGRGAAFNSQSHTEHPGCLKLRPGLLSDFLLPFTHASRTHFATQSATVSFQLDRHSQPSHNVDQVAIC